MGQFGTIFPRTRPSSESLWCERNPDEEIASRAQVRKPMPDVDAHDTEKAIDGIVDSMHNLLLLTDRHLMIEEVNPATCRVLGLSPDEILRRPVADFLDPIHWRQTMKQLVLIELTLRKNSLLICSILTPPIKVVNQPQV